MAAIKGKFKEDCYEYSYSISDEQKELIIERLLAYYKKYGCVGEFIHQNADAIVYAIDVLSDIADNIIKFNYPEEN